MAWSRHGSTFTPLLGLGGGGLQLEILEHGVPSFDDVLRDPGRSSRLSTSAFLVDVGASVDFMLTTRQMGSARGGPVFGLRAGYVFAPYKGDWRLESNDVIGGPEVGLTGAYVRLLLGAGGMQNRDGF